MKLLAFFFFNKNQHVLTWNWFIHIRASSIDYLISWSIAINSSGKMLFVRGQATRNSCGLQNTSVFCLKLLIWTTLCYFNFDIISYFFIIYLTHNRVSSCRISSKSKDMGVVSSDYSQCVQLISEFCCSPDCTVKLYSFIKSFFSPSGMVSMVYSPP